LSLHHREPLHPPAAALRPRLDQRPHRRDCCSTRIHRCARATRRGSR